MKTILAFETSCDDTAVALYDAEHGLINHHLHSQIETHQQYGGVVPELASRDHSAKIVPLLEHTLASAALSLEDIDAVAYTKGPGLVGALLVGACFARTLAWARNIPSIGVHHLEAHLLAPMLEEQPPQYPFLVLLVSGGHTQLLVVHEPFHYELLGETLDDAVGEAFDKTAKMMGLAYPGGPIIEALAKQGEAGRWVFPRPMTDRPGLDLSFSGLKTFALRTWEKSPQDKQAQADLALAFEVAVCETLSIKCQRALTKTGLTSLVIAGGVAANKRLRSTLQCLQDKMRLELYYPRQEFCTDNAAMVAYAGLQRLQAGYRDELTIDVRARWSIQNITKEH